MFPICKYILLLATIYISLFYYNIKEFGVQNKNHRFSQGNRRAMVCCYIFDFVLLVYLYFSQQGIKICIWASMQFIHQFFKSLSSFYQVHLEEKSSFCILLTFLLSFKQFSAQIESIIFENISCLIFKST